MSKIETNEGNNKVFLKIIEGSLRQSVPAGTPDAVVREWQAGGDSGMVNELVFKSVIGKIQKVDIYDGEKDGRKFTTLNITLDENEANKVPVVGTSINTKYAQDLMKKLPSVDFDEEVRIRPFSFIPDGEDKAITGVEITQRDGRGEFTRKVDNFFVKKSGDKWEFINGFPKREKPYDDQTEEEREIYKIQAKGFLIRYLKEKVMTKFDRQPTRIPKSYEEEHNLPRMDEIDPEAIPF